MRIVKIQCKDCGVKSETLESVPESSLFCPSCESTKLGYKVTDKEFQGGCGNSCDRCSTCE